jgi:glucose-6-phosphate 1-dehydrogenase
VAADSRIETYVALRVLIDNWRWSGVPFYLRTGKSLPLSASEVRVQFRPTPHVLFAAQCGPRLDANSLTLRLQPNEGISLRFNGKVPGTSMQLRPVRMHFSYDAEFGAYTPEAYERLLLEAMAATPRSSSAGRGGDRLRSSMPSAKVGPRRRSNPGLTPRGRGDRPRPTSSRPPWPCLAESPAS